jgi:hypothetical protein
VKALEKKMFAISGLFGVLNSLYILWSRVLEENLLVLHQKIVPLVENR